MYLLDTVVVSDTMKRRPDQVAAAWLDAHEPEGFFLSVITLGEIQRGTATVRRREPEFATRLDRWLAAVRTTYAERLLSVTEDIALRWGELTAALGNDGYDLLIAATALEHDLTIATRNLRHFDGTGARLVDPFRT